MRNHNNENYDPNHNFHLNERIETNQNNNHPKDLDPTYSEIKEEIPRAEPAEEHLISNDEEFKIEQFEEDDEDEFEEDDLDDKHFDTDDDLYQDAELSWEEKTNQGEENIDQGPEEIDPVNHPRNFDDDPFEESKD